MPNAITPHVTQYLIPYAMIAKIKITSVLSISSKNVNWIRSEWYKWIKHHIIKHVCEKCWIFWSEMGMITIFIGLAVPKILKSSIGGVFFTFYIPSKPRA